MILRQGTASVAELMRLAYGSGPLPHYATEPGPAMPPLTFQSAEPNPAPMPLSSLQGRVSPVLSFQENAEPGDPKLEPEEPREPATAPAAAYDERAPVEFEMPVFLDDDERAPWESAGGPACPPEDAPVSGPTSEAVYAYDDERAPWESGGGPACPPEEEIYVDSEAIYQQLMGDNPAPTMDESEAQKLDEEAQHVKVMYREISFAELIRSTKVPEDFVSEPSSTVKNVIERNQFARGGSVSVARSNLKILEEKVKKIPRAGDGSLRTGAKAVIKLIAQLRSALASPSLRKAEEDYTKRFPPQEKVTREQAEEIARITREKAKEMARSMYQKLRDSERRRFEDLVTPRQVEKKHPPRTAEESMQENLKRAVREHRLKAEEKHGLAAASDFVNEEELLTILEEPAFVPVTFTIYEHEAKREARDDMEDAHFDEEIPGQGTVLGVCDGHGGAVVAEFVALAFPERFKLRLGEAILAHPNDRDLAIHEALAVTIKDLDEDVRDNAELDGQGSTLVVSFFDKTTNKLYTATVGDAEANFYPKMTDGKTKSLPLTPLRDWECKKEKDRALKGRKSLNAPNRAGNLSVSRAIGDKDEGTYTETSTEEGTSKKNREIISKPKITVFPVKKGIYIWSCDGLRDHDLPETPIIRAVDEGVDSSLAERLVKEVADGKDNVTVIAVRVS